MLLHIQHPTTEGSVWNNCWKLRWLRSTNTLCVTSWGRFVLEKLAVNSGSREIPSFYGTWIFITATKNPTKMGTILRQWIPFLTFPACFWKILFHIAQVTASLTRSLVTLNIFIKILCVCLISCACYSLPDSEWFSCLGSIHSTVSPAVTWYLYSCGTLRYRNLDWVKSEKIWPHHPTLHLHADCWNCVIGNIHVWKFVL